MSGRDSRIPTPSCQYIRTPGVIMSHDRVPDRPNPLSCHPQHAVLARFPQTERSHHPGHDLVDLALSRRAALEDSSSELGFSPPDGARTPFRPLKKITLSPAPQARTALPL